MKTFIMIFLGQKVERGLRLPPSRGLEFRGTKKTVLGFVLGLALMWSQGSLSAAGPAPLNLLSTANFVILSGAAITTTGGGTINGDVGASPIAGSAIGVTCAQVVGTIYAVDASGPPCAVVNSTLLTKAKGDLTTAYNDAAGRTPIPSGPNLNPGSGNIGGMNLAPGLYKFTATAMITGSDVTLTGGPDDVWIFQCAQDLQLGSGIKVILAGGARAKNIFWQVGTSAVLGTFSVFSGTILADQAITMETSSTIDGRALASSAGVTFNGNGAVSPDISTIGVQQPLGTNLVNGGGSNNFGSVAVGTNSSLTFTITNTGSSNLTGLSITIDGADSSMFNVMTNPVAPVAPNGNTTFTVRFTPLSSGLKSAALHLANNDINNNPFNINLTGTGTGTNTVSGIRVQQPPGTNLASGVGTNNFGLVAIGTNASLTFTITNAGTTNLTGLNITVDGTDATLFSVTTNPVAPVAPNGTTTFTVRFAPLSPGQKTAALHIANNDANNNPFNINLTGAGTGISVQQPPGTNLISGMGSNNFGSVVVGTNTSLSFTIANTGSSNLTGLGITIDGPDSVLFSVTTSPVAPVVPNGSTTFTVRFTPLSTGLKTATLHLANNDPNNNPFNIILTGTGTGGAIVASTNLFVIAVSPITLNPQTGLFEQTVRLTNSGSSIVGAVRLLIQALPADVQVYYASGSASGTPYVQWNFPLAPTATVDFTVEYYRPNRQAIPPPALVAQETSPVSLTPTGTIIPIDRFVPLRGRFLVEFSAVPGKSYALQYSNGSTNWTTVIPIIIAPANRVQWYDDGPYKTESKPGTVGSRFYRVVQLP